MIRKNKQIKASNLKMEKNIDEVIKFFELEENIKQFLNKKGIHLILMNLQKKL